ncbi:MAG: right-handed parallel beta-helix repeat-containing protein [Candidatus Diapherotrites archaeon]|nr:right-handed parallel beta-helix repeat-containing protein [Candidatus Diapherotrites archaeon]
MKFFRLLGFFLILFTIFAVNGFAANCSAMPASIDGVPTPPAVTFSDNYHLTRAGPGIIFKLTDHCTGADPANDGFLQVLGQDNVTLDCDGHTLKITGTSGTAVQISDSANKPSQNITVIGCTIFAPSNAISIKGSNKIFVEGNDKLVGGIVGVKILDSSEVSVSENTQINSTEAEYYFEYPTFPDPHIIPKTGIQSTGTSDLNVKQNTIIFAGEYGIDVVSGDRINIRSNSRIEGQYANNASNRTLFGIHVNDSASSEIFNNRVLKFKNAGMYLQNLSDSLIAKNRISDIGVSGQPNGHGIEISYSGFLDLNENTIELSLLDGIRLIESDGVLIQNNLIKLNNGSGIRSLGLSDGITVLRNQLLDNQDGAVLSTTKNNAIFTFSENTVSNNISGLSVNALAPLTPTSSVDAVIQNNVFTSTSGIMQIATNLVNAGNITVQGNTYKNSTTVALQAWGVNNLQVISDNIFEDNAIGIVAKPSSAPGGRNCGIVEIGSPVDIPMQDIGTIANTFRGNTQIGISLTRCSNVDLFHSLIDLSAVGIYANGNSAIEIAGNQIQNGMFGIILSGQGKGNYNGANLNAPFSIYTNKILQNQVGLVLLNSLPLAQANGFEDAVFNNEFQSTVKDLNFLTDAPVNILWKMSPGIQCGMGPNLVGGRCVGGNYWKNYSGTDSDSPADGIGDQGIGVKDPYTASTITAGGITQTAMDEYPLTSIARPEPVFECRLDLDCVNVPDACTLGRCNIQPGDAGGSCVYDQPIVCPAGTGVCNPVNGQCELAQIQVQACTNDLECLNADGLTCTLETCDLGAGQCVSAVKVCDQGLVCAEPSGECKPLAAGPPIGVNESNPIIVLLILGIVLVLVFKKK